MPSLADVRSARERVRDAVVLTPLVRATGTRGVVTASAGNHAEAVAYHGARLGIPVEVVMPEHTPLIKVANTRRFGAGVRFHGATLSESMVEAYRIEKEERRVLGARLRRRARDRRAGHDRPRDSRAASRREDRRRSHWRRRTHLADISVRDVEIVMLLETRGTEHANAIMKLLDDHGVAVRQDVRGVE